MGHKAYTNGIEFECGNPKKAKEVVDEFVQTKDLYEKSKIEKFMGVFEGNLPVKPANKLKSLFADHMLDLDIENLMHLARTNQMWCTVIVGGPIPVEVWSLEEPYTKWNSVSVPILEIKHAAMFSQSYTNCGFVDAVTVEQSKVLYVMKLTLDPPKETEGEQDDNPSAEDEEEKRKREEEQENRGFFG